MWVWPGWQQPPAVPTCAAPPAGYTVHAELEMEVPVEHGLLMENLLDLAHAPFTHTSTFARGWPVRIVARLRACPPARGPRRPAARGRSGQAGMGRASRRSLRPACSAWDSRCACRLQLLVLSSTFLLSRSPSRSASTWAA